MNDPQIIIQFWFDEIDRSHWFKKSDEFDETIRARFQTLHDQASKCELHSWRTSATGRLAEIIVLDQFSRNLYRDSALAFANDAMALTLAQEAISAQLDQQLSVDEQTFLYMPFMHSESKAIHQMAIQLFDKPGMESNYRFEIAHKKIIDRFGRYPHRNDVLGRPSSAEENAFLQQPGSSF